MNRLETPPRYQTLRDYLPPLRRRWYLVVGLTVLAIGLSAVYSVLKTPTYDATALLRFQGETADFGLVGLSAVPQQTSNELAESSAQTVTGPGVLTTVKQSLHTPLSVADLKRSVTAQVEAASNLVDVKASARRADFAAALANAVAAEVVAEAQRAASARYALAAGTLGARLRRTTDPTARALLAEDISRLQTLGTVARPAAIAGHAQPPGSPSSPKPVLYGIVAGILGLMIGVAAALLRESFDRRLRTLPEIEAEMDLPLLGHLPEKALGRSGELLAAARAGTPVPAAEAFRIIRQNLRFLDKDISRRTVLVTSAGPAEGKTTVAVGLALASAAAGKLTLLVECDLRRPTLADRLDLAPTPGLADYLAGTATPQEILQAVPANPSPNGRVGPERRDLVCIASGTPTSQPAELLGAARFETFLAGVMEIYDVVVIDSCPLLPVVDTLELLPGVESVVLCVRAGQTTRDQAVAATATLGHFPPKPTGLVITGTTAREGDGYYEYGYVTSAAAARRAGRGKSSVGTGAGEQ